jgi:hypothetical protein
MPKITEKSKQKVPGMMNKLLDDKFYNEFLEMATGKIFFLQYRKYDMWFQYTIGYIQTVRKLVCHVTFISNPKHVSF